MRNKLPKISIVLSFYNEEFVLPELLRRLRKTLVALKNNKKIKLYEFIFVNDNSTDKSEDFLMSQLAHRDIVLINMSRNFGVSECVIAGMRESSGDLVIYMDADLQDPPEVIPDLIAAWKYNPDAEVVYTTRIKRKGEHWLKLAITKLGYRLINTISDIELKVDSGDFKLITRKIVDHLLSFKEDKPYMRGLISWIGYKQIQIFYERDERFDGRNNTKMPVLSRRVIYYWLDRALISFSDAPLKFVLFFGVLISFLSGAYILVVLYQKLMGFSVPGLASLMSAILFLGSIQILILGVIGLYIGAIFREGKNRPKYIVKNIYRSLK